MNVLPTNDHRQYKILVEEGENNIDTNLQKEKYKLLPNVNLFQGNRGIQFVFFFVSVKFQAS